jgi:hypothetical protein
LEASSVPALTRQGGEERTQLDVTEVNIHSYWAIVSSHFQVTSQLTVRNSVHIIVKHLSEFLTRFYSAVTISSTFLLI